MIVLGIETSCDETAAAVYDGKRLLANVINTQEIHKRYGGVVPELASREHLSFIVPLVEEAFNKAGVGWDQIDGIAVTRGPGLVGSLLIGISFAKAAAFARNIPIIGVNHIEGHLWAPVFEYPELKSPFIGLIISGGHTQLWLVHDFGKYTLLGQTFDDAVGEAFDKAAKMLGMGYPGGPVIDKLSRSGNPEYHHFPRPALKNNNYNFSYSGLKTAVLYFLNSLHPDEIESHKADIAASFQKAAVDTLVEKTFRAAHELKVPRIVLGGGVASNSALKIQMTARTESKGIELYIPSSQFCTDNAAMIAYVGYRRLMRSESDGLTFSAEPSFHGLSLS
ncbi:hypothetical protein AMJ80_10630 [bacterium SM23_31]|nr:MAG: hypothetical protein AMJ80_10630 [bacterium SM23_31]